MNISNTSLSIVLIFSTIASFSSVQAQQNTFEQCAAFYRKQTVTLRGEAIEKSRWYKDRRVTFEDWRNPEFYSFMVRDNHQVEMLKSQGFDVRYYTNGLYYTVALDPTIKVPQYSEAEVVKQCQ